MTVLERGYKKYREVGLWALPAAASAALYCRVTTPEQRLRIRGWKYALWKARAHPLALYRVNPKDISHIQVYDGTQRTHVSNTAALLEQRANGFITGRFDKVHEAGAIVGGDWDRLEVPHEQSVYYRALRDRFKEGANWEETELFTITIELIEEGQMGWQTCETMEELYARTAQVDNLFESIRLNGYQTQQDIHNDTSLTRYLDEVSVNIARDGTMIFNGSGRHRLIIAKLLDIDTIPIRVIVRHAEWQRRREEVARCRDIRGLSPATRAHLNHPDLQDLLPKGDLRPEASDIALS